ncbi:MAG: ABC transporter ATP-binding protein [Bacteroidales bacterium]|nr:ABC transporter ATP-binding protein [Bacteroidales bacterium]
MAYKLDTGPKELNERTKTFAALQRLLLILSGEKKQLVLAFIIIILNAVATLFAPLLIGHTIDTYIQANLYKGVLICAVILLGLYVITLITGYLQTKLVGTVGQHVLFNLRNNIFNKLQELPIAFFNENKAGDLISRINNDTEKINQFFSQFLVQFIASIVIMTGAAVFLLSVNLPLGSAALAPAIVLLAFSKFITPWVRRLNANALATNGKLSAEIQESLTNFKVIIAFNRRDFFRDRFAEVNHKNYATALKAGLANNLFIPVYGFFAHTGQLIVLVFGIYLISKGSFTLGLLISFLAYINNFYNPLRQLAALWSNFQIALAAWDRISQILVMETNLKKTDEVHQSESKTAIAFENVSFSYEPGKVILNQVSFTLDQGKTYAFVGPTGGGKTTTASLIARLYDPIGGRVLLNGRDIRSYTPATLAEKIGFILQDPFLFTGTIMENILYGNASIAHYSHAQLIELLVQRGLDSLLSRFDKGLDTPVSHSGETMSLGQKQLVAFMRAVLRDPEILILDEATANIDTITEKQLELILERLPGTTTRIIIAHRLSTIENADEIFFVNTTGIIKAGSMENAIHLLMHGVHER